LTELVTRIETVVKTWTSDHWLITDH